MKSTIGSPLAATVIATAAGTGAWLLGIARAFWPAHPQIAAFLITVVVGIVVRQIWRVDAGRQKA